MAGINGSVAAPTMAPEQPIARCLEIFQSRAIVAGYVESDFGAGRLLYLAIWQQIYLSSYRCLAEGHCEQKALG